MSDTWLAERMLILIPIVLSLTVHEWAHAFSAWWLGDDTAAMQGRCTLNPVSHIDPVGTLVLPLLGVPFGWAKPVPVEPVRFRRGVSMRLGIVVVAVAGPISNILLACTSVVILMLGDRLGAAAWPGAVELFLQQMVFLNVILAVFNLLPIPPLDGSRVVDAFVPRTLRATWDRIAGLGPILLLVVILLPLLLGFSPLWSVVDAVNGLVEGLR